MTDAPGTTESGALVFASPGYAIPRNQLGMFGIEQILVKKHVLPPGVQVTYGALLHDPESGQYFLTLAELAQYQQPPTGETPQFPVDSGS